MSDHDTTMQDARKSSCRSPSSSPTPRTSRRPHHAGDMRRSSRSHHSTSPNSRRARPKGWRFEPESGLIAHPFGSCTTCTAYQEHRMRAQGTSSSFGKALSTRARWLQQAAAPTGRSDYDERELLAENRDLRDEVDNLNERLRRAGTEVREQDERITELEAQLASAREELDIVDVARERRRKISANVGGAPAYSTVLALPAPEPVVQPMAACPVKTRPQRAAAAPAAPTPTPIPASTAGPSTRGPAPKKVVASSTKAVALPPLLPADKLVPKDKLVPRELAAPVGPGPVGPVFHFLGAADVT
ncbi:hypothetical protein DENSPDRAFT_881165, partial [Dentipellis sp. KUC8613]